MHELATFCVKYDGNIRNNVLNDWSSYKYNAMNTLMYNL